MRFKSLNTTLAYKGDKSYLFRTY